MSSFVFVYNSVFERIGVIVDYEYLQVRDELRDIGSFEVQFKYQKKYSYFINDTTRKYLVITNVPEGSTRPFFGVVEKCEFEMDKGIIKLNGSSGTCILKQRCIEWLKIKTKLVSASVISSVIDMFSGNIVVGSNTNYEISSKSQSLYNKYDELGSNNTYLDGWTRVFKEDWVYMDKLDEKTLSDKAEYETKSLFEIIQPYLIKNGYGIYVSPFKGESDGTISIDLKTPFSLNFFLIHGVDRRQKNLFKAAPIIFSDTLGNIKNVSYYYNKENFCNVGVVKAYHDEEKKDVRADFWVTAEVNNESTLMDCGNKNPIGYCVYQRPIDLSSESSDEVTKNTITVIPVIPFKNKAQVEFNNNRIEESFECDVSGSYYKCYAGEWWLKWNTGSATDMLIKKVKKDRLEAKCGLGDLVTVLISGVSDEGRIEKDCQITAVVTTRQKNKNEIVDLELKEIKREYFADSYAESSVEID